MLVLPVTYLLDSIQTLAGNLNQQIFILPEVDLQFSDLGLTSHLICPIFWFFCGPLLALTTLLLSLMFLTLAWKTDMIFCILDFLPVCWSTERQRRVRKLLELSRGGRTVTTPRLQGRVSYYFIVIEVLLLMLSLESPRRSRLSKMDIIKVMRLFWVFWGFVCLWITGLDWTVV